MTPRPKPDERDAGRRARAVCLILFALALGVRLVYLQQLSGTAFADELGLIADARYYDMRGAEIADGLLVPDVPGFLSPAYCYAIGLIYAVFGPVVTAVKLVQALLGALSAVLLYLVGRRLFGESVGRIAGLALALYATHVYYTGLLLPAILIVFLHLLLIWVLAGGWAIWRVVLAGLLVGISILAKANALLLCPALALWIALVCPIPGRRPRLARIGILCAAAAATVAPITINNYRVSETFLLVTTTGGANLLKGNGPTATGTHAFLPAGAQATGVASHLQKRVDAKAAAAQSHELSAWAWRYMGTHPLRTLGLFARKALLLFNAYEWGIRDQFLFVRDLLPFPLIGLLPFWAVVPLGLVGALFAIPDWRRVGLLYALILVQLASFVLIFVLARYRLVMVACLMPFAAWLVLRMVEWARARSRGRLAAAGSLVVVFASLGWLTFDDLPPRHGFADQYLFVADHHAAHGRLDEAAEAYEQATGASWVDPRRVEAQRWRALFKLAQVQVELNRFDAARANLDRLSAEMEQAYPGLAHPFEQQIRELYELLSVVR